MDTKQKVASVSAIAPGKVNISFSVGSLRDDGSRGVATLYQAVSIYDKVIAHKSENFTLQQLGSAGFGSIPTPENNLAMRAAKLLAKKYRINAGVRLEVHKQIPKGSGMSGGAADAAAALIACNELWGLKLDRSKLAQVAGELGSDVPFALSGGTAVGTGHGDEFSQALTVGKYYWVIVPMGPRIDEDEALQVLDEHRKKHQTIIGEGEEVPRVSLETLLAVRSGNAQKLAETVNNDVQAASFKLAPELARVCELGEKNGALVGIMLAIGPGLAFLAATETEAQRLAQVLTSKGYCALSAHGPVTGARLTDKDGKVLENSF